MKQGTRRGEEEVEEEEAVMADVVQGVKQVKGTRMKEKEREREKRGGGGKKGGGNAGARRLSLSLSPLSLHK